jgi:hypothetical protein
VIFRWTDVNRSTRSKRGSHLLRRNEEIATFYDFMDFTVGNAWLA